ncbi:MAG TPA: sigma-70 family RNA polymerase sigma factor [Gaiellaceae bacterium]|nr:sigma-70 family RNA polymerase sigma factor [Gaiellaceae bacterium]
MDAALRRHYDLVFRYVRRRVPTRAQAEDLTQEVFAAASASLARATLTEQETLAWLYTVARRRLADEARRSGRAPARVDTPLELAPTPQSEYGPAVAREIARAVRELPEAQRRVVLLKLFDGLPFAEIAKRLGITEAAAKMRCLRGLEQVRSTLRGEGIEP